MGRIYTVFSGKGLVNAVEVFGDVFGGDRPVPCGEYNELEIYMNYVKGSVAAANGTMKVYWGTNGSTYYVPTLITDANPTVIDNTKPMSWQIATAASFTVPLTFGIPIRGNLCRISMFLNDASAHTCSFTVQASPRLR